MQFGYLKLASHEKIYGFILFQTIDIIKETSPEIPFYRELKKTIREEDLYNKVGSMLRNQKINEENADNSIASG